MTHAPRRRLAPVPALALVFALVLLAAPATAGAQVARVVVDPTADAGAGLTAALLAEDGSRVAQRLVPAAGRVELRAGAAGTYRVALFRVGFVRTVSAPVALAAGAAAEVRVAAPSEPVALARMVVRGRSQCRTGRGALEDAQAPAATLWEEVRKALDASVLARDEGLLRASIEEYERAMDPADRDTLSERATTTANAVVRDPFVTPPPAELVARGFARLADGQLEVYAPDARVLLHPAFLEAHCFGVRAERTPEVGWIGLTFEPARAERSAGVRGVLWVDAASAELRRLDFSYVSLPHPFPTLRGPAATVGGEVRFERLPSGLWAVRDWRVRIPIPGQRRLDPANAVEVRSVAQVRHVGGRLFDVAPTTRAAAADALAAAPEVTTRTRVTVPVRVRVLDVAGAPIANAEVSIAAPPPAGVAIATGAGAAGDSTASFRTDSTGTVHLGRLDAGERRLRVRALGFVPFDEPVAVADAVELAFDVRMARPSQPLPEIRVAARRSTLADFERRARTAQGTFLTRDDIAKRGATTVPNIFLGLPGLVVREGSVSFSRGFARDASAGGPNFDPMRPCQPTYYVDGVRGYGGAIAGTGKQADRGALASTDDAALMGLDVADIEAVEVYRSAGTLPPGLTPGENGCGVIVIWTRKR